MIRAVFFDLDNTLYSYDCCAAVADKAGRGYCLREFHLPEAVIREDLMKKIRMGNGNQ